MRHEASDARPRAKLSREGVPWRDYRPLAVAASLPVGIPLAAALQLLSRHVVAEPVDLSAVPRDAILYLYHVEAFLVTLTPQVWDRFGPDIAYLGFHGFASYFGTVWPYAHGFRCFRYDKRARVRPLDQIVSFLRAHPELRFALRTDAGGPYGTVRASVVDLALRTGRPLVGMRQFVDRGTTILRHVLPLPGALIRTRLTRTIPTRELEALSREEARLLLQREIDALE